MYVSECIKRHRLREEVQYGMRHELCYFLVKIRNKLNKKKEKFKRFVFSFFVELFIDWIIFTHISSKKQGPKISLCECQSFKKLSNEERRTAIIKKKYIYPKKSIKVQLRFFLFKNKKRIDSLQAPFSSINLKYKNLLGLIS